MSEGALLLDFGDWSKQQAGHGIGHGLKIPGNFLEDVGFILMYFVEETSKNFQF